MSSQNSHLLNFHESAVVAGVPFGQWLLNGSGLFNPDAIEAQLAHRPQGGAVRAAYLRGEFFDERIRMMEWWSDYLEKLSS